MNVARFVIASREWGDLPVLRPYPKPDEIWGDLAPLKGTVWESMVPIVSGASLSHALHGRVTPLMQEIGPAPRGLLRMVPKAFRTCREAGNCITFNARCIPDQRMPECFVPTGLALEVRRAVSVLLNAWAEGRYVLVVEGGEFSF
jgi:hypothetical protein